MPLAPDAVLFFICLLIMRDNLFYGKISVYFYMRFEFIKSLNITVGVLFKSTNGIRHIAGHCFLAFSLTILSNPYFTPYHNNYRPFMKPWFLMPLFHYRFFFLWLIFLKILIYQMVLLPTFVKMPAFEGTNSQWRSSTTSNYQLNTAFKSATIIFKSALI